MISIISLDASDSRHAKEIETLFREWKVLAVVPSLFEIDPTNMDLIQVKRVRVYYTEKENKGK